MPNEYRLSSAATAGDLEKAFASAKKALSMTDIKMAVKKPDLAKVAAKMTKADKLAEFMLSRSGVKVALTIDYDGKILAELGEMSIVDAKGGEATLATMVALKLMSKAEVDKLKAGMQTGPDPKVAANELRKKTAVATELRKKLADLKKKKDADAKISKFDVAERDDDYFAGLVALIKAEHSEEGLDFIAAVKKKVKREKIIEQFIGIKAKNMINIRGDLEDDIRAGGKFDEAVEFVKAAIEKDTMSRYKSNLSRDYQAQIKTVEAELETAEAELKALG